MSQLEYGPTRNNLNWEPFTNSGSLAIPAFGICMVDNPDGAEIRDSRRLVLKCKRPENLGFTAAVMVNGPNEVEPGRDGICTDGRIVVAAYNERFEIPKKGEQWGPVANSSYVRRYVPGGKVLRDGESGRVILLRYEHYDVYGELTEALAGGGTAECKLLRSDKNDASNPLKVVEESADDPVRFTVFEGLYGNTDFEELASGDRVIARWDEMNDCYILRGWKC